MALKREGYRPDHAHIRIRDRVPAMRISIVYLTVLTPFDTPRVLLTATILYWSIKDG